VDEDGVGVTGVVIVMLSVFDADVPAVAVTVTLKVPEAVGVPLITPAELIDRPPGSPLADQVIVPVPPVAARVAL
jgi:hypothetical protein